MVKIKKMAKRMKRMKTRMIFWLLVSVMAMFCLAGFSSDAAENGSGLTSEEDNVVVRIVLDAGHGGPGTEDVSELGATYQGLYEKDLTLVLAMAVGAELSTYGNVEVYYTRTEDTAMSLAERADYAALVGADYLISIHLNASEQHNFYGSEVFTSAFGNEAVYGQCLGKSILNELVDYGFTSKGVKTRLGSSGSDYYGIIRRCREYGIPAIIVEHGYMDEVTDWARMDSPEELSEIAVKDAQGIASFVGLKKGEVQTALPDPDLSSYSSALVLPDTTAPESAAYTLTRVDASTVQVTVSAVENESSLLYYGYSTDGGITWARLGLFLDGADSATFSISLPEEQEGNLRVVVYNNYELSTEAVRW